MRLEAPRTARLSIAAIVGPGDTAPLATLDVVRRAYPTPIRFMEPDFCTLFDSRYLTRGLALHASLQRVEPRSHLRAFCMDDRAHRILEQLDLPGLTAVALSDLERHDPELAAVKADRSHVEYLWTATPSVARYCLMREPDLEAITYVDADVYFFSSPEPLFAELGGNSTQIVPHRYAPQHQHFEETSGTYNVEWVTSKRDQRGLETLDWWRERCLEWCYERLEDGKFGDQKYLDDWPQRFSGVNVLQHIGGGVAPWNVANYTLGEREGRPYVDDLPIVFYHYHALQLFRRSTRFAGGQVLNGLRSVDSGCMLWRSAYPRSAVEERLIWDPYLDAVGRALEVARTVDHGFVEGLLTSRDLARQAMRGGLGHAYHQASRIPSRLHLPGARA